MENKIFLKLEQKFGFSFEQVTKLVDLAKQGGIEDLESEDFMKVVKFVSEKDLIESAEEVIMEQLRLAEIV